MDGPLNIQSSNGTIMLGCWVDLPTAKKYLKYYQDKYPVGKPFPNGKGYYNLTYCIVHKQLSFL